MDRWMDGWMDGSTEAPKESGEGGTSGRDVAAVVACGNGLKWL